LGDLFEKLPEALAKFLDFLARFGASPARALQKYVPDDVRAAHVSGELVGFCLWSAFIAAAMFQAGNAIGMAEDSSATVAIVGRLTPEQLPLFAALGIAAFSVLWHALAKAISRALGWLIPDVRFSGTLPASLNAGLALGAFYTVATSALLVAARIVAADGGPLPSAILYASGALGLALAAHFIAAIAAVHGISRSKALALVSFPIVSCVAISLV
jgi:hypothetical protein